jgi:hypothetical protein
MIIDKILVHNALAAAVANNVIVHDFKTKGRFSVQLASRMKVLYRRINNDIIIPLFNKEPSRGQYLLVPSYADKDVVKAWNEKRNGAFEIIPTEHLNKDSEVCKVLSRFDGSLLSGYNDICIMLGNNLPLLGMY